MSNFEKINGVGAINNLFCAYQKMKGEVINYESYKDVAINILRMICEDNESLCKGIGISNCIDMTGNVIGNYHIEPNELSFLLADFISDYNLSGKFTVKLNYKKEFSMLIETDNINDGLIDFVYANFIEKISFNTDITCIFSDVSNGGIFFEKFVPVISILNAEMGGKIITSIDEIRSAISNLNDIALNNIQKRMLNIVDDFKETLIILQVVGEELQEKEIKILNTIIENSEKNGMSIILLANEKVIKKMTEGADYYFSYYDNTLYMGNTKLPFECTIDFDVIDAKMSQIAQILESKNHIETEIEKFDELLQTPFAMNDDRMIRIPFGVNRKGKLKYYEIGGDAPAHALISGTTGSGKSVALHTLIMQICFNYHPDDVEIWAVDYKAVEFDTYMKMRSPHFKVIAHDTSEEFSLSFVDLLYKEYERRQQLFIQSEVKGINQYRRKNGKGSMPRIIVIIDEFQMLTQAVNNYSGNENYRIKLENIFRLSRAMGISLILCSQTIATGLNGLTDAAKAQIEARMCLRHQDANEIRETLLLHSSHDSSIISRAKNLKRGQALLKNVSLSMEVNSTGDAEEYEEVNIFYIKDDVREKLFNTINSRIDEYQQKDVIIVKGNSRMQIDECPRHPLNKYIFEDFIMKENCPIWYPAAPVTLEDYWKLKLGRTEGSNILFVGDNVDMQTSLIFYSVVGFIMNLNTEVCICNIDCDENGNVELIEMLKKIQSKRLHFYEGIENVIKCMQNIKKIKPMKNNSIVYIWLGLDKLKNTLFLYSQEELDEVQDNEENMVDEEDIMAKFNSLSAKYLGSDISLNSVPDNTKDEKMDFETCKKILKILFENGPANGHYSIVVFESVKQMKRCGIISLDEFENRVASKITVDDSYELFGTSMAISKCDDNSVLFDEGKNVKTVLRPYYLPNEGWIDCYNSKIEREEEE